MARLIPAPAYGLDRIAQGNGKRKVRAMPITIYGIKNCDTMKKARAFLDKAGVEYAFHDYKSAGIERARLETWAKKARLGKTVEPRRHDFPQIARQGQRQA